MDMDFRQVFSDDALRQEFLDRFDELADSARSVGGLEGLDGGLDYAMASEAVERMAEGAWGSAAKGANGLEAIIRRFGRPVYLVQGGAVIPLPDGFPGSDTILRLIEQSHSVLATAIPSVGRIDLYNHMMQWAGTAWMVGPGLAVTNRHVATLFCGREGDAFVFDLHDGQRTRATIDWFREYLRPEESRLRVAEIVWMEPRSSDLDVALLRMAEKGEDGQAAPAPIGLLTQEEIAAAGVGHWTAVIGYPAYDSRNDINDQQRIFDGIYNCKRVAPGRLTAIEGQRRVHHDATTLGGNSGSVVLDLSTGKAMALHFGGRPGVHNSAVPAPLLADLVREHGA